MFANASFQDWRIQQTPAREKTEDTSCTSTQIITLDLNFGEMSSAFRTYKRSFIQQRRPRIVTILQAVMLCCVCVPLFLSRNIRLCKCFPEMVLVVKAHFCSKPVKCCWILLVTFQTEAKCHRCCFFSPENLDVKSQKFIIQFQRDLCVLSDRKSTGKNSHEQIFWFFLATFLKTVSVPSMHVGWVVNQQTWGGNIWAGKCVLQGPIGELSKHGVKSWEKMFLLDKKLRGTRKIKITIQNKTMLNRTPNSFSSFFFRN